MKRVSCGRLGVISPYVLGEDTLAACAVADVASQFGLPVTMYALGGVGGDAHHYWDREVERTATSDFESWARRCRQLVWFDYRPKMLERAAKLGIRNLLVVDWLRYGPDTRKFTDPIDSLIFPSRSAYELFCVRRRPPAVEHVSVIPWDCLLPARYEREDRIRKYNTGVALAIVVDSQAQTRFGRDLLARLPGFLKSTRALRKLTLLFSQALPDAKVIAKITEASANVAVSFELLPSLLRRAQLFREHDWAWVLAPATSYGAFAVEALSSGCPVIAMNVSPFPELIIDGVNGKLLPSTLKTTASGAVEADFNVEKTLGLIHAWVSDVGLNDQLRSASWHFLELRRREFQEQWKTLLSQIEKTNPDLRLMFE